jgi:predicted lipoprotein
LRPCSNHHKDIENATAKIHADWKNHYAARLTSPSDTGPYRSHHEAVQELFKALSTGLQFTSDTRLGRPLGTFDRPRPRRAEVWRSGRSSRHVKISLSALHDLAVRLAPADSNLIKKLVSAWIERSGFCQCSGATGPYKSGNRTTIC